MGFESKITEVEASLQYGCFRTAWEKYERLSA